MKAMVYTGPEALEIQEVADPVLQETDSHALIEVESVGICGSDMHAYLGHDERRPAPLILGHEAAGLVIDGAGKGKRVTVNPLVTCLTCDYCQSGRTNLCQKRQIISMPPREGAFAEFVTMPVRNLVEVPDYYPLDKAAMVEPIACGWHAVRLASEIMKVPLVDGRVIVLGGGAIGMGAACSLRAFGVDNIEILEPHPGRRDMINGMGEFTAITEDELSLDQPIDLVIDGVGYAATRATASELVRPGGVIMHIGLGSAEGGLNIRRMTLQEITFIGTYSYTMDDFQATAEAMFAGKLGALDWIETRSLDEGPEAFRALRAGEIATPKIILNP